MPWARYIVSEPPPAQQMEQWEGEGWSQIQVLGPCPAKSNDDLKGPVRPVYVVYLHRSILAVGREFPKAVN